MEDGIRLELERTRAEVDKALREYLAGTKGIPRRLKAAMGHSLLGGGKRLRPILALWIWQAFQASRGKQAAHHQQVMMAACGLEMLHTYSLIHDDLPAMDDDVLRRGRPTCHVAFGEGTAILAGDALQAQGFALLARSGRDQAADLVDLVAQAVGPAGMVGGQQNDLDAEGQEVTPALIRRIHRDKTAKLLSASLVAGGLLAGCGGEMLSAISQAGLDLGLAFQGADDILDVTATTAQLGKSAGKDQAAGKATWVALEGLEKARKRTLRYGTRGVKTLTEVLPRGEFSDRLLALGRAMWQREH